MKRVSNILTILGVAVAAAAVTGAGVYYYTHKPVEQESGPVISTAPGSPDLPLPKARFALYYYSPDDGALVIEEREIAAPAGLEDRVRAVLSELAKDPERADLACPIAKDFALHAVFIDPAAKRLYLDLAGPLLPANDPGALEGWAAIQSCVNTICALSGEIGEVQFLRDGQPIAEPLAGWDLSEPFAPEAEYVRG